MYMECPAKKRYKYDERREILASPAAQRGIDYHKQLEQLIVSPEPVVPTEQFTFYDGYLSRLRAIGAKAEYKFAVTRSWEPTTWDDENAWIIGVADIWIPNGEGQLLAHVQDWKTGKIYDSHGKQGEFYATSLFSYVPEAREVKATFIYTDLRQERNTTYHRDQLDGLRARWTARIERMERDSQCVPTPGYGCRFCPFSKSKGGPCVF